MVDTTKPEFWNERYQERKTPWDFNGVPLALLTFIQNEDRSSRVLVPGCGSGYEVKAFLDAGFDVWAIDFSEVAVAQTRKLLDREKDRVTHANFFTYALNEQPFDLIYERTFLCALPPTLWDSYAMCMKKLLRPEGKLIGFFFRGPEEEPPPYPLSKAEAKKLFGKDFTLVVDDPVADSLPLFKDKERWQVWQRC